jgi:cupin fold WbuC family metalloprotein
MALVQLFPDVFLAEGPIATIGATEIAMLRAAVGNSAKRRIRINMHPSSDDGLHEMMIAIAPSSYIRPHKHPGKSEAFHIIEGRVDIVVFGDTGDIERVIALEAKGGRHPFYYRMSAAYFHTLIIHSDLLVVHEITNGPFRPEDTLYAAFAPDENDATKAAAFQAALIERVEAFRNSEQQAAI